MNYKGWILSIYDEYKRRSDEGKKKKGREEKRTIKDVFKQMCKKENRWMSVVMITTFLAMIIVIILTLCNVIDNNGEYFSIPFIILFLGFLPEWYKHELNLEYYTNEVNILRKVLEDNDLYDKEIIQELYDSTKGMIFNVKTGSIYILWTIASSGILVHITYIDKVTLQYILLILMGALAIVLPVVYFIWLIATSIPNNRINRNREFHHLLEILITSDKNLIREIRRAKNVFSRYRTK